MVKFQLLKQANVQYSDLSTAYMAACLLDIPVQSCPIEHLDNWRDSLSTAKGILTVPIGSVEFIRRAMSIAGLKESPPLSYPEALQPFFRRDVRLGTVGETLSGCFVKPVVTKLFTGFLVPRSSEITLLDEHTIEQHQVFLSLPKDTQVWISEPVKFISEHRVYIHNSEIVGIGRYDDGEDDSPSPSLETIEEMLGAFERTGHAPIAYSIDAGVLTDGSTALVECNDAWALGYYKGTLSPKDYLRMLIARWSQICGAG